MYLVFESFHSNRTWSFTINIKIYKTAKGIYTKQKKLLGWWESRKSPCPDMGYMNSQGTEDQPHVTGN
jgi:hypothetical protein